MNLNSKTWTENSVKTIKPDNQEYNQEYIDSLNYSPKYIAIYSFKLAKLLIRKGFIVKDIKKNYKLNEKEVVFYFEYSEALNEVMRNYKTITNKQASYSAIVIQKVENGYMIDGYDLANPYFNVLTPILTGKKTGVEVNGRNVIYYNNWKNDIQQVKYKTIFSSVQELFNVICGYGKYLENIEVYEEGDNSTTMHFYQPF